MHWARISSVVAAFPLQNPHGYHTGTMDLLWKDYFRDPSPWHSNGSCRSPHSPRRSNHDSLQVSGYCNPSWVLHELSRRSSAVSPLYSDLRPGTHHHRKEGSFGNPKLNLDGDHDDFALVKLLKACAKKKDLCEGSRLHADIAHGGLLDKNPYIASSLISMYAKCGMLSKAQELHDELNVRKIDSWNALIGGFAQQGQGQKALNCFEYMECEGLSPDLITYISILKASGIARCLCKGEQIHGEIVGRGLLSRSVLLGTALVGMYAKCGELSQAFLVLEDLPIRNVFSWNALIAGYGDGEQGYKALDCFKCMQCEGISPDAVTFTCILNVCSSIGPNGMVEEIHKEISSHGLLQKDLVLRNAMVDMYVKCGMLSKAQELHDDPSFAKNVVTWNALIAGYAHQEQGHKALSCLRQMRAKGLSPDAITYACVLKACGSIGALHEGEQIHEEIVRRGLLENNIVLATALVDMYAKCGAIGKAQKGLEELGVRSIASWNALLTGYVQHGQGHEAVNCLERVRTEAFSPNAITFTCILNACGRVGAIDMGKQVHDEIVSLGLLRQDAVLGNALVDMYAKCGMIQRAQQAHDELSIRDVVSWNALITGYAHQGQGKEALHSFQLMQREGFSPDGMTLLGVLNACSRSGQFDQAQTYFTNMSCNYGLAPNIEHHTCVIVALGCIGCFDKVMSIISTLPTSYDPPLWFALLNACKKWGNTDVAKLVFAKILRLDNNSAAASYAIMDQISSTAGMREDAQKAEAINLTVKPELSLHKHIWIY